MILKNYMKIILVLLFSLILFKLDAQVNKLKKTEKGYQFVDRQGKKLSKLFFEDAQEFKGENSYAAVKINGKWGYINTNMEFVIEPQFDYAQSFRSDISIAKKGKNNYLIDRKGEIVSSPYDSLIEFRRDYYVAIINSKYGLIDNKDSLILELSFENFGGQSKIGYIVKKNGKWGYWENGNFRHPKNEIIYNRVDTPAIFSSKCMDEATLVKVIRCSQKEMLFALYRNIRYPTNARQNKIQGIAVIGFEINRNGDMENPEIVRDLEGGCGEEALRVLKENLNIWAKPAILENEPVKTYIRIPIKFRLE